MNPKKILTVLVLLIVVSFLNCHKDGNPLNCSEDLYICNGDSHPNAVALRKNIIGIWEWKFIKYSWRDTTSNCTEFLGNTIAFLDNGNVCLKINGITKAEAKWTIEVIDTIASIKIEPEIFNGWLVICEEVFGILQSQVDGPNNYYLKKK